MLFRSYLPYLAKRYGPEQALRIAEASDEVVDGIGAWCAQHGVDAWFTPKGTWTQAALAKPRQPQPDRVVA